MAKKKYFDSKNLIVGLKAIGTTIVTSLIWSVPAFGAFYLRNNMQMPVVSTTLSVLIMLGYIHTWGFFSRLFWNWK